MGGYRLLLDLVTSTPAPSREGLLNGKYSTVPKPLFELELRGDQPGKPGHGGAVKGKPCSGGVVELG